MDDERERDDIDRRIRAALTVDAAATSRIVERAFATHEARSRSWTSRALVAAAVAAIVAGGVWQMRTSRTLELAISGKHAWVVVSSSDGRRWIVGPASDRRQRGSYVIVVPQ